MTAIADILSPLEQEGTKSVVRAWLKNPGDLVHADDPIVELETDKVAVEVPAPADGILESIVLVVGADAPPGSVLGRVRTGSSENAAREARPEGPSKKPEAKSKNAHESIAQFEPSLRLSPSVRRLLIENALDPRQINGSGRDGRLTSEDVIKAATLRGGGSKKPDGTRQLGTVRIPHDAMRRRIAEHMVQSLATAPHVTAVFEADFSAIQAHRKANKAAYEQAGISLAYTAYVVAACAQAMKVAPAVNSRWHADHLEVFEDVNIGVGTALGDKGLIVPVIARAQTLSLREIAAKLHELIEKARAEKLTPADVRGGTFSISNHGVSGSLLAAPIIINQPQSAILGVGKVEKRVVAREAGGIDSIQVRPMAYVSLSIDHRVLDGHQTNAWLTRFVEVLENWPPA